MTETNIFRKNKINLEDYDYQKDIQNRVLMSHFSPEDLEVLEEIVYSSQRIPISRLVSQLDKNLDELQLILDKLSKTDLFKIEEDTVVVDKEMRKYFETQIQKFEDDFTPGMEFLQALLKKVPIHVLPNWYPIPRTSNNIFNSLIEKYLETPQIFQRYLSELNLGDPVLNGIITDLFGAPAYKMYSDDIRKKYELSEEVFEEHLLNLEFNLVCCLVYEKSGDEWVEVVTLFKEWKDYLNFLKESQPKEISKKGQVNRTRPHDFSFAEDLSTILALSMTKPLFARLDQNEEWVFEKSAASQIAKQCKGFDLKSEEGQALFNEYMGRALNKLLFLKLARIENNQLLPAEDAEEWLTLPIEKRALNTYKQTLSKYTFSEFPKEICTERNIHEIEKSIGRIIGSGWVLFDEFLKGIIAPISENSKMSLKKTGRYWKYSLPDYSEEELALIRKVIFNWLFEGGIIASGSFEGKDCLRITPLGQSMFG
ncbi:MAG: hypothetical protein KFB95_05555 [Simkaniaceae bacterium]|nr:MAG: hypothetical protein KFB95_05555 [Simkaniaceae bacterium]